MNLCLGHDAPLAVFHHSLARSVGDNARHAGRALDAFALAGADADCEDPMLARLVGGGFRDTTRIAASAPTLWTDILRGSPELPAAIDAYVAALSRLRAALDPATDPGELRALLEAAETYRRAIPEGLHSVPHA